VHSEDGSIIVCPYCETEHGDTEVVIEETVVCKSCKKTFRLIVWCIQRYSTERMWNNEQNA